MMKLHRTIPPAAAPIGPWQLAKGLRCLFSGTGPLDRLERELRDYFGVPHVFLLSSGKAALTIVLRSLAAMRPGKRQVVVPAYTCYSVPSAIVKAGLEIVPCDLGPGTTDFDHEQLQEKITDETLCVIPTHLFGIPAEMDKVRSIAREKGIFVVEDAAQAMGGRHRGKMLGTIGDVGFFSLDRGKNITCGGGGIIVTNDDGIAKAIRGEYSNIPRPKLGEDIKAVAIMAALSVFLRPYFYWFPAGLPFLKLGQTIFYKDFPVKRLSAAKAGLLHRWQERLERHNSQRAASASVIAKAVGSGDSGLEVLNRSESTPSFLRMPVLAENNAERDRIVTSPANRSMGISIMYPLPVSEIEEIRDRFIGQKYPVARDLAGRLFTVPTHPMLAKSDRDRLIRLLSSSLLRGSSVSQGTDEVRHQYSVAGER